MTTATNSLVIAHSNDATFRAWGSAFSALLAASGLIQTADTGQINWSTVLYNSTAPSSSGYEIWRFNDSMQSQAPIFLKIEYGSRSSTTPQIYVTVGQGSNGSGTLTGMAVSARQEIYSSTAPPATPQNVYACHTEGFFGLVFGASMAFLVARTVNSAGTPTNEGAFFMHRGTSTGTIASAYCLRFVVSPGVIGPGQNHGVIPFGSLLGGSTAVGLEFQIVPHYGAFPRIQPLSQFFSYLVPELTPGYPVYCKLFGSYRTYLPLSQAQFSGGAMTSASSSTSAAIAMLWE